MNALLGLGILTGLLYSLFVDSTFFKLYVVIVVIYYVLTQLVFVERDPIKMRRSIMIGSWGEQSDPTIYMPLDLDMSKTLPYLEKVNKGKSKEDTITLTYIMAKAVAIALEGNKKIVGRIGFGTFRAEKEINVTVAVNQKNVDLVPITVREPARKSLTEITQTFKQKASRAREDKDSEHSNMKTTMKILPTFMIGFILNLMSYITINLNIPLPFLKLKARPHGAAMITNVGSMKMPAGFAPLCPPMNLILVLCMGATEKKPVVVNDEIVIREVLPIVLTADHRLCDGGMATRCITTMREMVEDPEKMEKL